MKKSVKRLLVALFAVLIMVTSSISVFAEVPYDSYTYWTDVGTESKAVYSRPMYSAKFSIDSVSLGITPLEEIRDITVDSEGNLYILDAKSRIVILDKDYNFVSEIGLIGEESYNDAKGVYIAPDKTIYICDTEGRRILHATSDGSALIETIVKPESNLIPEDFDFRPANVVIDEYGYTYILSEGCYYGALLFDENMEFVGFYGANTVTATLGSVFTNIKNRIFPNNTKLEKTTKRLPYSFVDLAIDDEGFIYTSTGYTDKERKGQIRKLGPGLGNNILGSDEVVFVDQRINTSYSKGAVSKQDIFDIEVDSNGFVYGLESAFGKIFLYDASCRTLSVFGGGIGHGNQLGTFVTVSALAIKDDGKQILVSDKETGKITVFEETEFGALVKSLIVKTLKGDYSGAKEGWEKVIALDSNFQPAYGALARAYINEGKYDEALELAEKGYDRETYAIAFEYKRNEIINDNFVLIFLVLIAVIVLFIVFLVISTRKKVKLIKNKQLSLMFSTLAHPGDTFTEVKEKGQGSIVLCIALVLIYYVVTVLNTLKGGFLFTIYDVSDFNSLWIFVKTAGLVVLWVIANWMVCTLLGGRGRVKEIAVVTCYSLLPLIIERILRVFLTNMLLPTEASFLTIFEVVATLYFLLLMIIGLLKIHDISMARLIGTSVLSIAGVAAIVFLAITIIILVQQFAGFIVTVVSEILTL